MELVIGTYEEYLVGCEIKQSQNEYSVKQSFATRSHSASIRCITACGKYIASGGADDKIFVYDMETRKEIQILMHHSGTVNAITFTPDASHLLSGGDDGKMVAVRTSSWQIDAIWEKAHDGSAVTQIACHPSGKVALSLGSNLTLRTWNLFKGRVVYTTNLKRERSIYSSSYCISWSFTGDYFTISGSYVVDIWSIGMGGSIKQYNCGTKVTTTCWITTHDILIGLESGKVILLSVQKDEGVQNITLDIHKQRVKSICYLNGIVVTASSSGDICIWTIVLKAKKLEKIASINIGCRPTCMQVISSSQFVNDYSVTKEEEIEINEKRNICKMKNLCRINCTNIRTYRNLENVLNINKTIKCKKKIHMTIKERKDPNKIKHLKRERVNAKLNRNNFESN